MKKIIVRNLAYVYGEVKPETLQKFTVYDINGREIKLYEEIDGGYAFPRAPFLPYYPIEDANWQQVHIPFKFELYGFQKDIVNGFLNSPTKNHIIQASTGSGKTIMALYIAHKLGLKTLIVVPSEVLLEQWKERVYQATGIMPSIIRQSNWDASQPITIAMLQTLVLSKYKQDFSRVFGFTIYDEVHRLGADKFSQVAKMFHDKYRLGLSATPNRKDRLDKVFKFHIGNIVSTYISLPINPRIVIVKSPYEIYDIQEYSHWAHNRFLQSIVNNKKRNLLIAKIVEKCKAEGRKTLILTDRLQHVRYLRRMFPEAGIITGSEKDFERNNDILIGTYGACGEGFDMPELEALILATPRSDVRQAVGRITRAKETPIVFDIFDMYSSYALSLLQKRLNYYKSMNLEITYGGINNESRYLPN